MAYIFYDTETTGLSAEFDQILQFAALVTDDDLNVIEEVNLRCRAQPHNVLSPGALAITGMRPSEIAAAPLSHYEMVREIRALVSRHTPAVIVGFNSLGYDEGMLRQAFYQTLYPVYLTNTGGNTRMDMLRAAHAVSQYAPGVLTIPTNGEGRVSFKLELLAAANGLLHDHAHDALSDTLATLELARLIRDQAPKVWEALCRTRSKQAVSNFIAANEVFWATDMAFGSPTILAGAITTNPNNPSEVGIFDLGTDPAPYLDMGAENVRNLRKSQPRLIRIVKLNAQPILMPLDQPPAGLGNIDLDTAQSRARQIADYPPFAQAVGQAIANRYPERESAQHVEQRIYDGFPSQADINLMEQFHMVPWTERPDIIAQFADERLRELGERLIYIEAPEVLPPDVRGRYDLWRRERLLAEGEVPWGCLTSARKELADLRTADRGNGPLISEIEEYLASVSAS